jgi:uncharacterized protein with HEPN domain
VNDRDLDLLEQIVEVAGHIRRFASHGREAFDADVMVQYAVAHGLVLIGESAGKLSAAIRERYPEVPWRQIVAQRNVVVHEYDHIDLDAVWMVVSRDLEVLVVRVREIILDERASDEGFS